MLTKKLTLGLLLLSVHMSLSAEVGIGTTSPQAALDVTSTTDGILIPRMTGAEADAITSKDVSEIVYITTAGGTLSATGFHYWDGAAWQPIGGAAAGGNGIYNGSGTVDTATTVTLNNDLSFEGSAGNDVTVGPSSTLNLQGTTGESPLFIDGSNDNTATPTNTQLNNDFAINEKGNLVVGGATDIMPLNLGVDIIGDEFDNFILRMASKNQSPILWLEGYADGGELFGLTGADDDPVEILASQNFSSDPTVSGFAQENDMFFSIRTQYKNGFSGGTIRAIANENHDQFNRGVKWVFTATPKGEQNNTVSTLEVSGSDVTVSNGKSLRTTGAVYRNVMSSAAATVDATGDDVYFINANGSGTQDINLPACDGTQNIGRELLLRFGATSMPGTVSPPVSTNASGFETNTRYILICTPDDGWNTVVGQG